MKVAIQGCTHGDLDKIYAFLLNEELKCDVKVDLLICCGDFQAVRNQSDLESMACPRKYAVMKDFQHYYAGRKKAPVLTLFIGGNHEAANHMWQLPYGGWVAENIYYIGYAGVVCFKGITIAGISGIYNNKYYNEGHFERPPFNADTKRSFYYTRHLDILKLKLISKKPIDICLSHDWPSNIQLYGNVEEIYKQKPYLKKDPLEKYLCDNDAAEELLKTLKPSFWFSGHHHCKFTADVRHDSTRTTKFLALSKFDSEKRNFLEIIDVEGEEQPSLKKSSSLMYNKEWIAILKATDYHTRKYSGRNVKVCQNIKGDICSPEQIDQAYKSLIGNEKDYVVLPLEVGAKERALSQTMLFCQKFGLTNPCEY